MHPSWSCLVADLMKKMLHLNTFHCRNRYVLMMSIWILVQLWFVILIICTTNDLLTNEEFIAFKQLSQSMTSLSVTRLDKLDVVLKWDMDSLNLYRQTYYTGNIHYSHYIHTPRHTTYTTYTIKVYRPTAYITHYLEQLSHQIF